jgi:hypothetical protein
VPSGEYAITEMPKLGYVSSAKCKPSGEIGGGSIKIHKAKK